MPLTVLDNAKIITGSYTGDGNDDRNIDIGVNLTAKNHVVVRIKRSDYTNAEVLRTSEHTGDSAQTVISGESSNYIQGFSLSGFEIGTRNDVNKASTIYYYYVLYQE